MILYRYRVRRAIEKCCRDSLPPAVRKNIADDFYISEETTVGGVHGIHCAIYKNTAAVLPHMPPRIGTSPALQSLLELLPIDALLAILRRKQQACLLPDKIGLAVTQ